MLNCCVDISHVSDIEMASLDDDDFSSLKSSVCCENALSLGTGTQAINMDLWKRHSAKFPISVLHP